MRRKAKNEGYRSGFCGHSGFHAKCRVSLCVCPCHQALEQMALQEPRRG